MIGPIPIENINFNSNPMNNSTNNDESDEDDVNTTDDNNTQPSTEIRNRELWIEHERRQRTIRFLMMLLMMLILIDGEQSSNEELKKKHQVQKLQALNNSQKRFNRNSDGGNSSFLRGNNNNGSSAMMGDDDGIGNNESSFGGYNVTLTKELFQSRQHLDEKIELTIGGKLNSRWNALYDLNNGADEEDKIWNLAREDFETNYVFNDKTLAAQKVFHYPRNATGHYRGYWTRIMKRQNGDDLPSLSSAQPSSEKNSTLHNHQNKKPLNILMRSNQVADTIKNANPERTYSDFNEKIGIFLLPEGTQLYGDEIEEIELLSPNVHLSDLVRAMNETKQLQPESESDLEPEPEALYITESEGRLHFHLYSRAIRGMKSMSLIDGYVKVRDLNDYGFTNPKKHLFLRVHGVIIHPIGKISLVANASPLRSVFTSLSRVEADERCQHLDDSMERRRLQVSITELELSSVSTESTTFFEIDDKVNNDHAANEVKTIKEKIEDIRARALWMYADLFDGKYIGGSDWDLFSSNIESNQNYWNEYMDDLDENIVASDEELGERRRLSEEEMLETGKFDDYSKKEVNVDCDASGKHWFSSIAQPYPYVPHEKNITKISNSATFNRMYSNIPEVLFNTHCEFEINLSVNETQLTLIEWHEMAKRILRDINHVNPFSSKKNFTSSEFETDGGEALVMNLFGTMESPNCDFALNLNATAFRTDWEQTKYKSTLYSVYMMLATLCQIVVLLRQIIYGQSSMAVTRVSVLCVGWQTVIDALMCIEHIMLCLMVPPVNTAFCKCVFSLCLLFVSLICR